MVSSLVEMLVDYVLFEESDTERRSPKPQEEIDQTADDIQKRDEEEEPVDEVDISTIDVQLLAKARLHPYVTDFTHDDPESDLHPWRIAILDAEELQQLGTDVSGMIQQHKLTFVNAENRPEWKTLLNLEDYIELVKGTTIKEPIKSGE